MSGSGMMMNHATHMTANTHIALIRLTSGCLGCHYLRNDDTYAAVARMRPFFAQPNGAKASKRVRDHRPDNFEYLVSGYSGDVYLSRNATTVIKLFPKSGGRSTAEDEKVMAEFQILNYLGRVAPDYVPVPCRLVRSNKQMRATLGIQMPNVGPAIGDLLPGIHQAPLEPDEIALCILQSIHFVLLLRDRVKMEDVHSGNVCVQNTKENIRLRFIDVGMWDRYVPDESFQDEIETRWIDIVVNNAQKLFQEEEDYDKGLWREVLEECFNACRDPRHEQLLRILSSTFVVESGTNIFQILLRMAETILAFLLDAQSVCHPPAHALVLRIKEAEMAARASLRPSRRPSFYAT